MTIKIITTFISIFALIFSMYNLKIIESTKKNFLKNLIIISLVAGISSFKFEMMLIPMSFVVAMIVLFLENRNFLKNFISIILAIIIMILSDTI